MTAVGTIRRSALVRPTTTPGEFRQVLVEWRRWIGVGDWAGHLVLGDRPPLRLNPASTVDSADKEIERQHAFSDERWQDNDE